MGTISDCCCNSSKSQYSKFPSLGSLGQTKHKRLDSHMQPTMSSVEEIKPQNQYMPELNPLNIAFKNLSQNLEPCQEPIDDVYKLGKVIGGGQFGSVCIGYKLNDQRQNRQKFAIKSIRKDNLKSGSSSLFMNELVILKAMDHPNIINLYQVYEDSEYYYLVCQFCSGGELFERILDKGRFSEHGAAKVIYKVLLALNYMHEAGVCHRDLKPQNFMFASTEKHAEIKIIDFGLSKFISSHQKLETIVGTPYYVAPQVLRGKYNQPADMWSVGVLLYILLCGYPPFTGKSSKQIFKKILTVNYEFPANDWSHISPSAKDMIKFLLHPSPQGRLTALQALKHQWIALFLESGKGTLNFKNKLDIQVLKRLKRFSAPRRLQRQILTYVVQTCKDSEIVDLRNAFRAIDYDDSGYLTSADLKRAFREAGLRFAEAEIDEIIERIDNDNTGVINYTQFLSATLDRRTALNKERLWHAFKHFNPTGDGKIDKDDILQVFRRKGETLDEEEVKEMLEQLDQASSQNEEATHYSAPKQHLEVVEEEKPGTKIRQGSVPSINLHFLVDEEEEEEAQKTEEKEIVERQITFGEFCQLVKGPLSKKSVTEGTSETLALLRQHKGKSLEEILKLL